MKMKILRPEIKNHINAILWVILAIAIGVAIYFWDKSRQYFIAYLSFLAALFVFFVIDYFRRPNFVICLGAINESADGKFRFVHVNVINLDWPKWFFIFRRDIALNVTAEIIFKEKDFNKPIFSVPGRWSSNPEPIKFSPQNKELLFDEDKARTGGFINISPSASTSELREGKLGIAIKFDDENECYGFSDLSYSYVFKFPGWKLRRGIYDVETVVKSGRFSSRKNFVLENLGKDLNSLILKKEDGC